MTITLAERLWKISFPDVLNNLKPKVPKMGIVLNFPIDRVQQRGNGVMQ